MRRRPFRRAVADEGEFLWLVSLSDLMILLFVFFVVLFSYSYSKMGADDFRSILRVLNADPKMANPLDETQKKLLKWVTDRHLLNDVTIEKKEDALILQLREKVLFDVGEAQLRSEQGLELVGMIGEALQKIPAPYRIGIEGHTDDTPMRGAADNWELSAKRSLSVLKALKLDQDRLSRSVVMGYGSMRPLLPNRDDKGHVIAGNQQKNRRVTIRIF